MFKEIGELFAFLIFFTHLQQKVSKKIPLEVMCQSDTHKPVILIENDESKYFAKNFHGLKLTPLSFCCGYSTCRCGIKNMMK